jgi:hypothetical protein
MSGSLSQRERVRERESVWIFSSASPIFTHSICGVFSLTPALSRWERECSLRA